MRSCLPPQRTHWDHAINHSLEGEQRVGQESPMRSFNKSKRILTVQCDVVMNYVRDGVTEAHVVHFIQIMDACRLIINCQKKINNLKIAFVSFSVTSPDDITALLD